MFGFVELSAMKKLSKDGMSLAYEYTIASRNPNSFIREVSRVTFASPTFLSGERRIGLLLTSGISKGRLI